MKRVRVWKAYAKWFAAVAANEVTSHEQQSCYQYRRCSRRHWPLLAGGESGNTVWISGQIPLDPETMEVVEAASRRRHVKYCKPQRLAEAAGGSLDNL